MRANPVTRLRHAWRNLSVPFREPIAPESEKVLARAWERLPAHLQTDQQFLGRQYAGCGGTVGAMPRCDFACRGCYLGASSNRVPPLPLSELKAQLATLRAWLGPGGNLQLTDGEVSLREADELIELIRHARSIGLSPMLMSHGEGFRIEPERLKRLIVEGGLRELSVHIDSTQRGRRDPVFRKARSEAELMGLRDGFAELIRKIRRDTRRPLHVASTVTVTRDNLGEVASVVAWFVRNADAFALLSFQPVAAVGRTLEEVAAPVSADELWREIARGLEMAPEELAHSQGWLGHPDCSRFLQGAVLSRSRDRKRFAPLLDLRDPADRAFRKDALDTWGGLTFRLDGWGAAAARGIGLVLRSPHLAFRELPAWGFRWLRRASEGALPRALTSLTTGRARIRYLNIVSHHFMNRDELETETGRAREDTCVFKVAVDGELHSMCRVNATGLRDRWYAQWREEHGS